MVVIEAGEAQGGANKVLLMGGLAVALNHQDRGPGTGDEGL
jgi:hypothetical protein